MTTETKTMTCPATSIVPGTIAKDWRRPGLRQMGQCADCGKRVSYNRETQKLARHSAWKKA